MEKIECTISGSSLDCILDFDPMNPSYISLNFGTAEACWLLGRDELAHALDGKPPMVPEGDLVPVVDGSLTHITFRSPHGESVVTFLTSDLSHALAASYVQVSRLEEDAQNRLNLEVFLQSL